MVFWESYIQWTWHEGICHRKNISLHLPTRPSHRRNDCTRNLVVFGEMSRREKAANIKPESDLDIIMKAAALEGQKTSVVKDYVLKILALEICADTMVGNEMFRGISGGQKKRVMTEEMLVEPARALFMDEISTGLDSLTTYQIINSMRQFIHILNGTALISLLQPTTETYDLFDDILLISDGQVVYQGPRENVLEFFQHMGFTCPLVEMSS